MAINQRSVIATCLVGLPVGLIFLGVASMLYTEVYAPRRDQGLNAEDKKRGEVASLMQRPVEQEDLERHLRVIADDIGERNTDRYEALKRAAFYIESTLGPSNLGYPVERQTFEADGKDVWNLEATLRGSSRPDEIVVVGAHYDSVHGSPAANDNGTGVAALLSLARAFAGSKPERTIRFVAFVNEEPPYFQTDLMGSLVYARQCRADEDRIIGMIALETMGYYDDAPGSQNYPPEIASQYPDTGNFIAFVGNVASAPLIDEVARRFGEASEFPYEKAAFPAQVPGVGWSDHWAFWQAGYQALMVTDTAPYRYEHYHQASDTFDKIDFPRFTEVTRGMKAVVEALANPSDRE